MERVYLDHHAATPLSPEAAAALTDAHARAWANASSAHTEGRAARAILEDARRSVASALGASAADVVLTSGGTEACNLGVLGLAAEDPLEDLAVVTSTIEHPAIERAVAALAARGAEIHALALHDPATLEGLRDRVASRTRASSRWMLATQAVSHETGTILDVFAVADAMPRSTRVVIDACQALGKIDPSRFAREGWAIAIGGGKIGATAGSGALVTPRALELAPRVLGGAQERGRRAGTPDVAAHAALGAACRELEVRRGAMPRIAALRDRLEHALVRAGALVNGTSERVATVTNVSFRGWRKATLVAALDLEGVSVSAGAACSSGLDAPSPVVRALHPDEPWRAESCLRFSLGPDTTDRDIDLALAALSRVLARRPG